MASRSGGMGSTISATTTSAPGELLDRRELRLLPGALVDRYVILEEIGEGGMSIVYAAHDPRLDRKVAIKVLREAPAAGGAADRLVREAHALARVIHPHVIPVYDAGTVRGQVYLVEEYVDGGTLTRWLARARPTWRDILHRFVLAGRGLHAAHEAGLVHRDFKPDNVLLGRDGRVRVVDFGLSCGATEIATASHELPEPSPGDPRSPNAGGGDPDGFAGGAGGLPRGIDRRSPIAGGGDPDGVAGGARVGIDCSLTRTGAVMGTPAYMAPEQHAAQPTDARTDLFGFCVALWEALYGELPFGGATPVERAEQVLRGSIRPAPPSPVPGRVRRALSHGLRVSPDERPASMAALLDALERAPSRNRRRALLIGGAAAAIAIAGVAAWWPGGHPVALPAACAPLAEDAAEIFVDAAAAAAGTGTARCPLRTLTAALALPSRSARRTIVVAAGTYDRTAGEQFPLVVRGGVTIAGAGADATRIVGSGRIDHTAAGGVFDIVFSATLMIGDARDRVAIRDVSVTGEASAPEMGVFGVVCDRGTLASFDGAPPAANTELSRLTIGPGYEAALVVGTSSRPAPTGCNLAVTGSTLKGAYYGAWVLGCGTGDVPVPVAAAIGDGSEPGRNFFRSLRGPGTTGVGLRVWDCTRSLAVRGNTFEDSDVGISVIRHLDAPAAYAVVVEGNKLHALTRYGAIFSRAAIVDRFDHNWIFEVSGRPSSAAERAVGLVLDGEGEHPPGFPQIRRARHNKIVTSDVGIELRGTAARVGDHHPLLDFGRPDDPGHNLLRCNGTERGAPIPGYDVHIAVGSDGSGTLLLAGNTWDHVPPRIARGPAGNGTEVVLPAGAAPALDTSGAIQSPDDCGFDSHSP